MKSAKTALSMVAAVIVSFLLFGCGSDCPTKEKMKTSISTILPVNLEVMEVAPLKEISGLCEVVVKTNNMPVVFYVDKKGKFVLSGSIVELKTKRNITSDKQRKYSPSAAPAAPQKQSPKKSSK